MSFKRGTAAKWADSVMKVVNRCKWELDSSFYLIRLWYMYKILKISLRPSCPRSYYSPALLAPLQSTTLPPPLLPALIPSPGGQTEKWRLYNKLRKMESFHYNSDNPDPFFSAPEPFLPAAVSHHQAHPRSLQLVGKQISEVLIWSNQNQILIILIQ